MVFYFSGTGCSKYLAETIAKLTQDSAVSISECYKNNKFDFDKTDKIGFVFPIHAWQPPLFVQNFIKKISVQKAENTYFYVIYVCGDESGHAEKTVKKLFDEKGFEISGQATIVMPNNYIVSFNTDSEEETKKKISAASDKANEISEKIVNKEKFKILKYGKFPTLKTGIIAKFFQKYMLDAKPFHIEGNCINCKICEQNCPTSNISVKDGIVNWGNNCTMCLSCIHCCPEKVIQYGNTTQNKGRFYLK